MKRNNRVNFYVEHVEKLPLVHGSPKHALHSLIRDNAQRRVASTVCNVLEALEPSFSCIVLTEVSTRKTFLIKAVG